MIVNYAYHTLYCLKMVFPLKPGSAKRPHSDPEDSSKCNMESPKNNSNGLQKKVKGEPFSKKKKVRPFDFSIHPKRKIALQFLYYGWEYDGLVQQKNTDQTVEKYLMDALIKTKLVEDWKECDFSRCGRTDKGVSAFTQVAALVVRSSDASGQFSFWPEGTDQSIIDAYEAKSELNFVRMLNGVLPKTISVTAWAPVPKDFSARHGCNMRIYKYSMPKANLDMELMQDACNRLVGQHDFRNFCQIDLNEARVLMSYVREIYEARIEHIKGSSTSSSRYDLLELTVKGSGFLWHMIRFIVTILHEIGRGNEKPELVSTLLDVAKTPSRPHYALACDTPLCLFDCRFDSANLEWNFDDYAMKKTVAELQSTWAGLQTKARMMENMLGALMKSPVGADVNEDRGLIEFTQDRCLPVKYVPFAERKTCDSLEEKVGKLLAKKKEKERESETAQNKMDE